MPSPCRAARSKVVSLSMYNSLTSTIVTQIPTGQFLLMMEVAMAARPGGTRKIY